MNPSLYYYEPRGLGNVNIGALDLGSIDVGRMLALPGFKPAPAKPAEAVATNGGNVIDSVLTVLNSLVVQTIQTRTAAEFVATRQRVFPRYYDAVLGLSYLMQSFATPDAIESMVQESFKTIESSFAARGVAAFGTEVCDQAVFTSWTLKRIADVCRRIDSLPLDANLKDCNSELFTDFLLHAMCTRFSLDCLSKSMTLSKPIYPEVMPVVIDGLRSAVNCYAYVKRAYDLRCPTEPVLEEEPEWDDEDAALLREASASTYRVPA